MTLTFIPLLASPLTRGLLYGAGFALVEFCFTSVFKERADGSLKIAPDLRGYTTWAMVPGSILGGLYALEPYMLQLRPGWGEWQDAALRILFMPLVIWTIEIIYGLWLLRACNGTRAWHYKGRWARVEGTIKLSMVSDWIGFGLIAELLFRLATVSS